MIELYGTCDLLCDDCGVLEVIFGGVGVTLTKPRIRCSFQLSYPKLPLKRFNSMYGILWLCTRIYIITAGIGNFCAPSFGATQAI